MKIPSKEEKMSLRYRPVLFPVALLAGVSLLVSGCGQTSGDDTAEDTPLSMALSFNEPILVVFPVSESGTHWDRGLRES